MTSIIASLLPPLVGCLLLLSGADKVARRSLRAQAARSALPRLLRDPGRAVRLLRATGVAELAVGVGLLVAPLASAPILGGALLGAGFLAYLVAAKLVAPDASCGCTASDTAPVGWYSFARAGAVALGAAVGTFADDAWWTVVGDRPLGSAATLLVGAAGLGWLMAAPEHRWLTPLRRLRLRLFGHPLTTGGAGTPVAASVELLERSLAWETVSPIIRSGLLEHWDEDGWRILHYAGAHRVGEQERPVSVLFALDVRSTGDGRSERVIRVGVVDRETEAVLTPDLVLTPDG
ncbi:MauE/DoxX family redox-associated membrane protein [Streptomyces sp. NBRC 109706]|uniref:MauE/DoxX family redox-associated membrane protein n=1 Tax=Streptomyces sp. NBRC 109706 TaxID=1550035 RepID=UPI0007860A42|nr:MauE/DoxX family redox-associated membrane protein [Streptomyces sp. NBRC 109706]